MNFFNAEKKLLINIVLALFLGIIFGNFLGNIIASNNSLLVNANNYNDQIYILQSGIYYDEISATIALSQIKAQGINGLVVKEHNKYYVYHQIGYKSNQFDDIIKILEEKQIEYFIKTKSLYHLLVNFDQNSDEFKFYYESINYFLALIHNQNVVFSSTYINKLNESDMSLFNNLNTLNINLSSNLAPLYILHTYKSLVDILL